MNKYIAAQETISEARASLWHAVKIDPGRRALEGDIESAYNIREDARSAIELGKIAHAREAVAEARELLRTEESRIIAEDAGVLEDAIRLLADIRWD